MFALGAPEILIILMVVAGLVFLLARIWGKQEK